MYVLYPADCPDGFGAAFAAHLSLGDAAHYCPVRDPDPLPEIPDDRDVWLVDVHYGRETVARLGRRCPVRVIRRHGGRSGSVLTHRHFFAGEPVPPLFQYLEDQALGRWQLASSREVNLAISTYRRDFASWRQLVELSPHVLAVSGSCIARTNKFHWDLTARS